MLKVLPTVMYYLLMTMNSISRNNNTNISSLQLFAKEYMLLCAIKMNLQPQIMLLLAKMFAAHYFRYMM